MKTKDSKAKKIEKAKRLPTPVSVQKNGITVKSDVFIVKSDVFTAKNEAERS